MNTINLNEIRLQLKALENPEKGKPLSRNKELLKNITPLKRSGDVFLTMDSKSELKQFINLSINVIAPSKSVDESVEDLIRKTNGSAYLDQVICPHGEYSSIDQAITSASEIISTHAMKMNDSSNKHQILGKKNNTDIDFGVYGAELETSRSFAVIKKPITSAVFSIEFIYKGNKTNLFQLIGEGQDGDVDEIISYLISLCADKDKATSAIRGMVDLYNAWSSNNGFSSNIECRNQLLFPTPHEDYVALSPVPSYSMLHALKQMESRFFSDEKFKTSTLRMVKNEVGGANAINAGDYNLYVSGKHSLLLSELPKVRMNKQSNEDRFLNTLNFKSSFFCEYFPASNDLIKSLVKLSESKWNLQESLRLESLLVPVASSVTSNIKKAYLIAPIDAELKCSDTEKQYILGKAYIPTEGYALSRTEVITEVANNYAQKSLLLLKKVVEKSLDGREYELERHHNQVLSILTKLIKSELIHA
ncbi:hypothetical protein QX249_12640 [Vibrio parahaemolyticus]|uniref:Uncharacterized protein n=1 Tax=Vibrio parahaemolyticus TaxID=670 RepID=A0AAW8PZV3_VIBPH|nr:hypothetical protein [Vibrio parahaemolyticus]EGR2227469.1 hypothetical protein [Vibrio parahaemolyticus]MDS1821512.1 hypothetical protein [Vibrio parahaemolyticus]